MLARSTRSSLRCSSSLPATCAEGVLAAYQSDALAREQRLNAAGLLDPLANRARVRAAFDVRMQRAWGGDEVSERVLRALRREWACEPHDLSVRAMESTLRRMRRDTAGSGATRLTAQFTSHGS